MKVLIGCESSGRVRDAFAALGHDAMSCDLLPTDSPGQHYQGDLRDVLDYPWDLAIFHPPCTHLSVSGARHFEAKRMDGRQQAAVSFFMMLAKCGIPKKVIENPICIMSSIYRRPNQIIQPHEFGHPEFKATCLWLYGVRPLVPTNRLAVPERGTDEWIEWNRIHRMPPGPNRWKDRSETYQGIADALAAQYGAKQQMEIAA